jgi:hypothetical protein
MADQTPPTDPLPQKYYFLDEAGDGTLFNARGRVLVGTEGCSRFFVLGLLEVPNPDDLGQQLDALRSQILADPYFRGVPSLDPQQRKTAVNFHAKDDLPEVRREVFRLLRNYQNLKFYAIVTDKLCTVNYVYKQNKSDPTYRYHPNSLYDLLVRRLCRDRLIDGSEYYFCFARRGGSDRTTALQAALLAARDRYNKRFHKTGQAQYHVTNSTPVQTSSLQAVDYFLWALQRCYERQEDRYLEYVWPAFRLVMDIDDRRSKRYGEYYTSKKPLTLAALAARPPVTVSRI